MTRAKWKWGNVPIPEVYVASLAAAVILHMLLPLKLLPKPWIGHTIGWPVLLAGILVLVWAVLTIADIDISKPTKIITSGPYALSRNPMYVAWTFIGLGIGLTMNTLWLVFFLSGALLFTHFFTVPREERYLEQHFGQDYLNYKHKVRRWL